MSLLALPLGADVVSPSADEIFARYQEALRRQQEHPKDLAMDVTMEATIPKLKKHGKLNALRQISNVGKITYKILGFSGDDTVKKEVMARFMTAEVDSAKNRTADIAISSANYSYKYKGLNNRENAQVYVFELKPRTKRVGLFKGELWVDPSTYLPVREEGRFVKNPSVFIKKIEFVRRYEIRDGMTYLVHMESKTDTRVVGPAQLDIDYANYHQQDPPEQPAEGAQLD